MPRAVLRTRARQVITAIVTMALVVTIGITVSSKQAEAAITNPFTTRYSANTNGSILITGNTNTFNDSEAPVGMPTGGRVLFAGLYYLARVNETTAPGTSIVNVPTMS